MKYIIEHLDRRVYKWCFIEYRHISKIVGKKNLIFTNLTKKQSEKLSSIGKCYEKSISELSSETNEISSEKCCILDPKAEKALTPADAKKFEYLVFGGILGDDPPQDRTAKELIVRGAERRNIGKEQFPTDNAVYVCKKICEGNSLEKIEFQNEAEIEIKKGESVIFPFKYAIIKGKPLISEELHEFIKKKKGF